MLIVMTIMLMLVVIALPAVKRVMEDGNVREASRQLNAYFAMAKARALQTGRPCGVQMVCEPVAGNPDPTAAAGIIPNWPTRQVTKFYLAEVPPPYSGGTIGARGRIQQHASISTTPPTCCFYPLSATGAIDTSEVAILQSLITPGETFLIRFDLKGAWYVLQYVAPAPSAAAEFVYQAPSASSPILGLTSTGSTSPIPPGVSLAAGLIPGYTYQIIRLPRRIGSPLELTTGTAVDIAYSGIGPTDQPSGSLFWGMYPNPSAATNPPAPAGLFPMTTASPGRPAVLENLTVMFTPGGGIDSVYLNNFSFMPSTTVHFLIGRGDKLNSPFAASSTTPTGLTLFDPTLSNLADPNSLWVSVSRSTGNVVTSDNLPPPISAASGTSAVLYSGNTLQQQTINPNKTSGQVTYLALCRQLATNREQIRGQ
jgi:type II secretory pathway pseudopilin PulG